MTRKRPAFTLVEMIVVGVILAIIATVAVPRFNFAGVAKHKVEVTAKKIVTDLRRARQMAISDAANNTKGFELTMLGAGPYTSYRIENQDTHEIVDSHTIDSDVTVSGDSIFRFGPQGNLTVSGHTQITVSAQGKTLTITVIVATGSVTCVES
jgi:prepilin-type N-terminal cleavage/methylation domain-containing protein